MPLDRVLRTSRLLFKRTCSIRNDENTFRMFSRTKAFWDSPFVKQLNEKLTALNKLLARQCNVIAAQRARRTAQIIDHYRYIYGDRLACKLLQKIGKLLLEKGKSGSFLLGAALFSWEENTVTDDDLKRCVDDMVKVEHLGDVSPLEGNGKEYLSDWEKVIGKDHLKVWRTPIPNSHLYEYKVYGTYYDITPRSFFDIQVDLEYRKAWDHRVISLDIIDKDRESGSEVVHWVTKFPRPMWSRDYVYVRRYQVDEVKNVMVLTSRAVEHPACPETTDHVRVSTYVSQMVVRPHSSFDRNGFDYVMTYYDDPQSHYPSFVYKWLATAGVPEFVEELHVAARDKNGKNGNSTISNHLM